MKTSVTLSLDTRREKADGTYSVLLRITHYGKLAAITTGISLKETEWDDKERKVKASYRGTESVTRLNNLLQKKKTVANDLILKLDEQGVLDALTVFEIKELVEHKRNRKSFLQFGEELRLEMIKAKQIGNARTYKFSLSVLRTFVKGKDVAFTDLTYEFLKLFEIEHFSKGNKVNGLSVYLRTWRAIFNEAIRRKLVGKESYPFAEYKIGSEDTLKLAIDRDYIRQMLSLPLKLGHAHFHARNYFLLSFYTRGTSFFDLALLRVSNVKDGRIKYKRKKSGREYDVKVTEEIQPILDFYMKDKAQNDYLLPIVTEEDDEAQYKEIEWARKRYNANLKELGKSVGLERDITSRVSRHSFATVAKLMGIDVAAIKDMLGHGSLTTTEIYLAGLPNAALDTIHEKINKG